MDRITAINKSLTGFVCGLVGLVPVIGLIPAVYSLRCWFRVQARFGTQWNPASMYLRFGAALALLGLLGWGLVVVALLLIVESNGATW